jgi:hypothetical protein
MPTTWTISVDWDRNGNFSGTYDDISAYVHECKWQLGYSEPFTEMADNAVCTLTLNNQDRRFSPENASSPIYGKILPLRPIRIQSNDGITSRTHWLGWIQTIKPYPNPYGERQTMIVASDGMQFLKAMETKLPLQENKRTDEIVDALLKEVIMPPALNRAFLVGVPGNAEVGITTYLASSSAYEVFDTGIFTPAIAADNWVIDGGASDKTKSSFDVYRAIRDITAAERGKFFFDREGRAVFWNRHHTMQPTASSATFNDTMSGLNYTYAGTERLKNEIIVTCHPRTLGGDANTVLWDLGESVIRVEPSKPKTVYVRYEDEGDQRVGAKDVTVTDVVVEQGSATVSIEANANGAELIFTNTGNVVAFVTAGKVKGRKLLDSGQMDASAIDHTSQAYYGRRVMKLNLPSLDLLMQAEQIAEFEKDRRSNPVGEAQSITLISDAKRGGNQHDEQLARTMGDKITVTETQTGHSADYWIVGESHEMKQGGSVLETTWYLEAAPTVTFIKVGTSTVGNAHVLGY